MSTKWKKLYVENLQYDNLIPTTETLSLTGVSQAISPSINYTFLNSTDSNSIFGSWSSRFNFNGVLNSVSLANSSTADETGIYVAGPIGNSFYSNPIIIYNADGSIYKTITDIITYNTGVFKYDFSGQILWSFTFKSANAPLNITNDSTGIYVSGYYQNTMDIYDVNNVLVKTLPTGTSNTGVYLVKFNKDGYFIWATRVDTYLQNGQYFAFLTVDNVGNVYLGSTYSTVCTIYNSNGSSFASPPLDSVPLSTRGYYVVVKYNSAGTASWYVRGGNVTDRYDAYVQGLYADASNVYVAGTYYSYNTGSTLVPITNSDGSTYVSYNNAANAGFYIIKYNISGFGVWNTQITAGSMDVSLFDTGNKIDVDSTGVYITHGYNDSAATVYNSDGSTFTTLAEVGYTSFVIKYNLSGFASWVSLLQPDVYDVRTFKILLDGMGGIYVTGTCNGNVNLYNSDNTLFASLLDTSTYGLVVKYDTTGFGKYYLLFKSAIGGSSARPSCVTLKNNSLYVSGYCYLSTDIYNSDGTVYYTIPYLADTSTEFLVKFQGPDVLATLGNPTYNATKVISTKNMNYSVANITATNLVYNGSKTTITLDYDGQSVKLGWNGTNWFVISNNGATFS